MDYLELDIKVSPVAPWSEILISQLAEFGFNSFTESTDGLKAYGSAAEISLDNTIASTYLGNCPDNVSIEFVANTVPEQNWNATWEADFEPVFVEDLVAILAPFHNKEGIESLVVEIQPKMSFGTGHHQTTFLMSKSLFDLDLKNKRVLDVGSGTGVLAIIAHKLGAKEVVGTDIEDGAVENAIENQQRNGISDIQFLLGDIDVVEDSEYDLVLANINKNVLKSHMSTYAKLCKKNGSLFLSGFFSSDLEELTAVCAANGFEKEEALEKEGWAVLKLKKQ
jgi:ribosomal protein L11 methyltransferase